MSCIAQLSLSMSLVLYVGYSLCRRCITHATGRAFKHVALSTLVRRRLRAERSQNPAADALNFGTL
jgi:hypothetical protein